ncbi:MAG: hypothetical protein JWQ38_3306, partial [Flavipsychrobacter sp.]|nr:hypothetical protein [Flavipsychrobacter sp.]
VVNPYPYYNLDAQLEFQISSPTVDKGTSAPTENPTKNYMFVHLAYASNLIGANMSNYSNNYLSAQIGVSFDIINSIKNYKSK